MCVHGNTAIDTQNRPQTLKLILHVYNAGDDSPSAREMYSYTRFLLLQVRLIISMKMHNKIGDEKLAG